MVITRRFIYSPLAEIPPPQKQTKIPLKGFLFGKDFLRRATDTKNGEFWLIFAGLTDIQ